MPYIILSLAAHLSSESFHKLFATQSSRVELPQYCLNSIGTVSFGREQPNKHVRTNNIIHLFIIDLIVTDNVIQWHIMDTWNGLNDCAHLLLSCHLMYKMCRTIMFHAKVESFVIREVTVQTFPTYTKSCRWFRSHLFLLVPL